MAGLTSKVFSQILDDIEMKLTAEERRQGWVIHSCPAHGPLVACSVNAVVVCRCHKKAQRTDRGRALDRAELQQRRRSAAPKKA